MSNVWYIDQDADPRWIYEQSLMTAIEIEGIDWIIRKWWMDLEDDDELTRQRAKACIHGASMISTGEIANELDLLSLIAHAHRR